MKKHLLFFILFSLASSIAYTQKTFEVIMPDVKTETDYIWMNLKDIKFFEENGYKVAWPEGQFMEQLKTKALDGNLNDNDYALLYKHMESKVYTQMNYFKANFNVSMQASLIDRMVIDLKQHKKNWEFKIFPKYKIILTLYGPGGSYNADNGTITLFANSEGKFKQYNNPACTIIHEIIHIGIENSIIKKYDVPHTIKERIVDNIVNINFNYLLPGYKIQDMGYTEIDNYLKNKDDIKQLDEIVRQLTQSK
ncbi:MAG: hypothetical protein ACEPOV_03405 [Hyphomicrobiales bacterium]